MNVLQVALNTVYPPSRGGEHRMHGLVSSLPSYGNEVVRFCQGGLLTNHAISGVQRHVPIDNNYQEYRPANPFYDVPSVLQLIFDAPGYFPQKWLELSFPHSLSDQIDWADVVLVEDPFQIPPIAKRCAETPVVYSSHNVESERLRSRSRLFPNRYNNYLDEVEEEAVRAATAVICTSQSDLRKFQKRFGEIENSFVAPNAIYRSDLRDTRDSAGGWVRDELDIEDDSLVGVFVGSDYGPNREAARSLRQIADKVNTYRPFDVIVVGAVSDTVSGKLDTIHPVGHVDSIEPYYDLADLALNPMQSGGGSNVKLVEYMGKALPVVSTPFGARGFKTEDQTNILIANLDSFAKTILETDSATRHEIGGNAFHFVNQNYTWEIVSKKLNRELKEIIES